VVTGGAVISPVTKEKDLAVFVCAIPTKIVKMG
jgi:hypothetical protein